MSLGRAVLLFAATVLPQGAVAVGYTFTPQPTQPGMTFLPQATAGTIRLTIDGRPAGELALKVFPTIGTAFGETFDIGQDRNAQVSTDADARKPFDQKLGETRITLP